MPENFSTFKRAVAARLKIFLQFSFAQAPIGLALFPSSLIEKYKLGSWNSLVLLQYSFIVLRLFLMIFIILLCVSSYLEFFRFRRWKWLVSHMNRLVMKLCAATGHILAAFLLFLSTGTKIKFLYFSFVFNVISVSVVV